MILLTATGCSSTRQLAPETEQVNMAVGWNDRHETRKGDTTFVTLPVSQINSGIRGGAHESAYIPKARIYRTNGDYDSLVPVTLDASRTKLISFPAPSDLKSGLPVKLDEGFLLDNRGIGENTAFTRWTYAEYSAMESAPSPQEIMKNIIPDARVTEIYEMPFTVGTPDAAERSNKLIEEGLPGCNPIFQLLRRE